MRYLLSEESNYWFASRKKQKKTTTRDIAETTKMGLRTLQGIMWLERI